MKAMLWVLIIVVLVGGLGGGGWWLYHRNTVRVDPFRTVAAKRGDLLATIGATGTVEPEEVVDVGAQVAGQILAFGKDPADETRVVYYGTTVNEGTVLAQID